MTHKITLLQEVIINGLRYNYGTVFDFDKAFLAWLMENKINHQVTGK